MTTSEIAAALGLSVSGARKAAAAAVAAGALNRDGLFLYRNGDWCPPSRRLVAIELKLAYWRKALEQAQTYLRWADTTWVVMGRTAPDSLVEAAGAIGVGVALLDDRKLNILAKPERQAHDPFNTARLLAGEQAFAQAIVSAPAMRGSSRELRGLRAALAS
jgi:hypothetical protein